VFTALYLGRLPLKHEAIGRIQGLQGSEAPLSRVSAQNKRSSTLPED